MKIGWMKTSLLTLIAGALLAGTSSAAPQAVAKAPATVAAASVQQPLSSKAAIEDAVGRAFSVESLTKGTRAQFAAACECIKWKETCSRECELWTEGRCTKWSKELVCREVCAKWSCEK